MKKTLTYVLHFTLLCVITVILNACRKGSSPAPPTVAKTAGQIDSALLSGRTLISTKIEGSNDGITWVDLTASSALVIKITLGKDNALTWSNGQSYTSGSGGGTGTGNPWQITSDGKTLNLINSIPPVETMFTFTIVSVSQTTCVFIDPNGIGIVGSNHTITGYNQERFTCN
jgi:hypothetical protein